MRKFIVIRILLLLKFSILSGFAYAQSSSEKWVSISDGKSLKDWEGDSLYWSVENGNLVGTVRPETLLKRNSFIIWRGGIVSHFGLKVEYRVSKDGNSGINYRSEELKDVPFALVGYQGDIDGHEGKPYTGMNYEERGRTIIARRGQKVELPPLPAGDPLSKHIRDNQYLLSIVKDSLGTAKELSDVIKAPGNWNEYHIIAKGNNLRHFINGVLVCDVTDNDPVNARLSGLLGVQVHVGPPMKIEYRNFLLRRLK